ncbi:hypothetical protein CSA56_04205 [candidate division KSB3 bacterium]|uniref:Uncharacterized protein n=1 Tax=candidate division KSB3 bacterium TaxID=2044937 RepID=A0A2G6KKT9_9BACT|nr:MAG: hypothetical protein CSA56_04205 [candidate division KSB3 bacterium]
MPEKKMILISMMLAILLSHLLFGCHSSSPTTEDYYQEGLKYKSQNAFQQAAEQFRLALSLNPHHADSHRERGIVLCHTQNYRQAVKHLLRAQQYGDVSYHVASWMGYAYERLKKWNLAEHFYQEALKRAPTLIDIRLRLADLFEQQNKRQNAAEILLEALALKPDIESADFLQHRALLLQQPQSQEIHQELADLYIRHGDMTRGIYEYRQAQSLEDDNPDDVLEFAIFCLNREQYASALNYFQQAESLGHSAQPDVRAGLGVAYEQLERYEDAVREYRTVLHLEPQWHELHLKIAELLKKLHKPLEAADELEHLYSLSLHTPQSPLGTGIFPDANQLWAEILRLRSETLDKAVVYIQPSQYYPVVHATVNTTISVTLLVEEDARYTILSERLAQSLGIHITSRTSDVQFYVDGQRYSAPLINLPSLKVGGLEVRNIPTVIWDLSRYPGIDGFLGKSFLKHFQVEIKNAERLFILTKFSS